MIPRVLAAAAALALASVATPQEVAVDLASPDAAAWLREDSYEVLCGEHRVGRMRRALARTEFGGVPAVARDVEVVLDVAGDDHPVVSTARRVFGATGPQLLLEAADVVEDPFRRVGRRVTRGTSRFDVVTERRGERVEGAVEAIDVTLPDELGYERLVQAATARPEGPGGAKLTTRGMDVWTLTAAPRQLALAGVSGDGAARRFDVAVTVGGIRETAALDATGALLEGTLGPRLRYRRASEDAAKAPLDRAALAALAKVPLDAKLDPVATLTRLVVAWDEPKPRVFSATPRQRLRQEGQALVVESVREGDAAAPDDAAYREALADEAGLGLREAIVGEAAAGILERTHDVPEQVRRLLAFVSTRVRDEPTQGSPPVADLLRQGDALRGDATTRVRLFVALCRAVRIPARPVHGLAWDGDAAGAFRWHPWAEVVVGGRWLAVDPSSGAPAPVTHLRIDAPHDARTVLWGQKLRLVAVEREEPAASDAPK